MGISRDGVRNSRSAGRPAEVVQQVVDAPGVHVTVGVHEADGTDEGRKGGVDFQKFCKSDR